MLASYIQYILKCWQHISNKICSLPKQKPSKLHIFSECWQHISNETFTPQVLASYIQYFLTIFENFNNFANFDIVDIFKIILSSMSPVLNVACPQCRLSSTSPVLNVQGPTVWGGPTVRGPIDRLRKTDDWAPDSWAPGPTVRGPIVHL